MKLKYTIIVNRSQCVLTLEAPLVPEYVSEELLVGTGRDSINTVVATHETPGASLHACFELREEGHTPVLL